ncbi:MAG: RICIN domain-containing protein [Bacteroidota bacterium]
MNTKVRYAIYVLVMSCGTVIGQNNVEATVPNQKYILEGVYISDLRYLNTYTSAPINTFTTPYNTQSKSIQHELTLEGIYTAYIEEIPKSDLPDIDSEPITIEDLYFRNEPVGLSEEMIAAYQSLSSTSAEEGRGVSFDEPQSLYQTLELQPGCLLGGELSVTVLEITYQVKKVFIPVDESGKPIENGRSLEREYEWFLKTAGTPQALIRSSNCDDDQIVSKENISPHLTLTAGQYYTIENRAFPYQVLDVGNSAIYAGAKLYFWSKHGGNNQQFRLEYMGDDWYLLANRNSGQAVDFGTQQLIQWNLHGGNSQLVKLTYAGDGYYFIESKLRPGEVIKLKSPNKYAGREKRQNSLKEMFRFVPVQDNDYSGY